ncbi:hypothetical protein L0F63_003682, partial [Massospora cicadina]
LHVQVNFETGEKMAKLLDESASAGAVVKVPEGPMDLGDDRQTQREALDPLLHVPLEHLSDRQRATRYMKVISLPISSEADVTEALRGLLEIAGDFEIGSAIIKSKEFSSLFGLLDEPADSDLKILAASVLGAALQNNAEAQMEAHRWDLTNKLLSAVQREDANKSLDRLLFALSASVRGNRLALEAFYRFGGDRIFLEAYKKSQTDSIRRKLLALMVDIADPSLQPEKLEGADEISLLKELDPNLKASISDWCEALQKRGPAPYPTTPWKRCRGFLRYSPSTAVYEGLLIALLKGPTSTSAGIFAITLFSA